MDVLKQFGLLKTRCDGVRWVGVVQENTNAESRDKWNNAMDIQLHTLELFKLVGIEISY